MNRGLNFHTTSFFQLKLVLLRLQRLGNLREFMKPDIVKILYIEVFITHNQMVRQTDISDPLQMKNKPAWKDGAIVKFYIFFPHFSQLIVDSR